MIDRDSCACFICGSPDICEHREFELIPYWCRLMTMDRIRCNRTPVNPPHPVIAEPSKAPPPRKPPAIAQIAPVRQSLAQGERLRDAGGRSGYSALRGW